MEKKNCLIPDDKTNKHYLIWNNNLEILKDYLLKNYPKMKDFKENIFKEKYFCIEDCQWKLKIPSKVKLISIKKKSDDHPQYSMVPLSPHDLNNINVEPKLINYGTVNNFFYFLINSIYLN